MHKTTPHSWELTDPKNVNSAWVWESLAGQWECQKVRQENRERSPWRGRCFYQGLLLALEVGVLGEGGRKGGEALLALSFPGLRSDQGQAASWKRQQLKASPIYSHTQGCWSGSQEAGRGRGVTLQADQVHVQEELAQSTPRVCWNSRNCHTALASLQACPENRHLCFQRMVAMITFSWGKKCQKDKYFVNHCMSPACKLWVYLWNIYLLVYSPPLKKLSFS